MLLEEDGTIHALYESRLPLVRRVDFLESLDCSSTLYCWRTSGPFSAGGRRSRHLRTVYKELQSS